MKKLIAVFFFSGMLFFANAQVSVGIIGGVNQSTIVETNNLTNWSTIKKNYKWLQGFHAGVIADIPLNKKGSFVLEPGVTYYNKGRKYFQQFDTLSTTLEQDSSFKQALNYIDIPLNLLLKFGLGHKLKFIVGGGPYISFFFNGSEKSVTNFKDPANYPQVTQSTNDLPVGKAPGKYTTMDYGVTATAGFEVGKVSLRASASQSLGDMYQARNYNGSFKNQVISVSLAVMLANINTPAEKKRLPDSTRTRVKPAEKIKKIKDRDGDGVADKDDRCPNEPGTKEMHGCPDRDGDGVADKDDKCPDVAGPVSNKGCPLPEIDTDGDGIPDSKDKCPTVKGLAKYNGCPFLDTDGDYIPDDEDKCPTVPGVYRYHGCPIPDTDGDGVNDEIDRCPLVPGLKTNHGCPLSENNNNGKGDNENKQVSADSSCNLVYFDFNDANLDREAYNLLQTVVEKLKANRKLEVSIKGYTDNVGSDEANNRLSEDRAKVVADYIATFYINSKRLHITWYGKQFPLADPANPVIQWKNRRVEICFFEKK